MILRFWNNQVDRELEGVMTMILNALDQGHRTRLAPEWREPPSPEGEG